jgi:hypothetical protein
MCRTWMQMNFVEKINKVFDLVLLVENRAEFEG